MKKSIVIAVLLYGCFAAPMWAQDSPLSRRVTLVMTDAYIEDVLYGLIDQGTSLTFNNAILPRQRVTIDMREVKLQLVLDAVLRGTDLTYSALGRQVLIVRREQPPAAVEPRRYTISGFLEDARTGERLIGASILERVSQKGTVSNEYGFFSLTLPAGMVSLAVYYLGYEPASYLSVFSKDQRLDLALSPSVTLAEVVVTAADTLQEQFQRAANTQDIDLKAVTSLPNLAGEADLIRVAHLLPGVQTGPDGIGGMHIRGGNPDQNLILIDGVPVYYVSHAAGLFSIFNTSAIRSVRLIKGGFPARYGGRTSSVLDLRTKEGNLKTFKADAHVGLLTASATLEGPIVKDKAAFLVSMRQSFLGWYLNPAVDNYGNNQSRNGHTDYRFFDLNAKLSATLTERDKVYLSYYQGGDAFDNSSASADSLGYTDPTADTLRTLRFVQSNADHLSWGNRVAAFRWNHLFSSKLFANTTLTFSNLNVNYDYVTRDSLMDIDQQHTLLSRFNHGRYVSSIKDIGGRIDLNLIPNTTHYIRFGVNISRRDFNPGALFYDDTVSPAITPVETLNQPVSTAEYTFYAEDEIRLGKHLLLNVGFNAVRASTRNKNFASFEPRLLIDWQISRRFNLHSSFSRMSQFLHLLSNSSLGLPTDMWVPATARIPPQFSDQVVLGINYQLGQLGELSVEAYHKTMRNLVTFSEGALFLDNWEDNLTVGRGEAYGVETMLHRQAGSTRGWLAYTLSWADRQFNDVNFGRPYPFKYDRRHDFKMAVRQQLGSHWELAANWTYSTGFAISLPDQKYRVDLVGAVPPVSVEVLSYGGRNQYRMPAFHRLDVSVNFSAQTGRVKHLVQLGAYNVYDRANPLYYDLRNQLVQNGEAFSLEKKFVQVSLLPFMPSFSYTISL